MQRHSILDLRQKSLIRGNVLVVVSLVVAFLMSDFPHNKPSLLISIPMLFAMIGTAETVRCMRRRWDFYHGGVILCIYMDLMAMAMILFFLFYPYAHLLT